MTKSLIIRIARIKLSHSLDSKLFESSPISVGSSPKSMLRFQHPLVAPEQGILTFTPTSIEYTDHDVPTSALVDGQPVRPGIPVPLREDTLVQVGPFRFLAEFGMRPSLPIGGDEVDADDDRSFDQDILDVVQAITSVLRNGTIENTDALLSFSSRSVKLADVIASVIIELRARHGVAGLRPFEPSPLHSSWDVVEISDYLLYQSAPDARLTELKRYLIELAWGLPSSRPEGMA